MKIFTYFVEPAKYSLDLIKYIHEKQGIKYCFIRNYTEVKSESSIANHLFLSKKIVKKIKFIYRVWKEHRLIIINGYNNFPFVFTFILNTISLEKKIIAIESDTPLRIPKNMIKRYLKARYLKFIFKSKFILGFSGGNYSHKELFRYYGMGENRIFLMPMIVDNSSFNKNKNKIKENIPFRFLFVGRFIKTKNIDKLVQLFVKHFSGLNAELHIVGDGELFKQYIKRFSYPNVKFLGKVFGDDLVKKYHSSSVFVFPSTFEAWGLVVNEAMSAGLPVVLREEVGAANDLILNNETGMIASTFDKFSEHMLTLYHDKEMRLKYSENAKKFMREKWNYDLYNKCLNDAIKKVEQWR
jgi:glycosyltransferase involved in cell wall biosynthesis